MADDIKDYSNLASGNTAQAPESMLPSAVNDTMREMMATTRNQHEDAQWINLGDTVTYASSNSFTITGDASAQYAIGRRVRLADSSTLYGTILTSVFSSVTTVTITMDSGSLTTSINGSNVSLGIATDDSIPATIKGRVIAEDGIKLDEIESNATEDQTATEILTSLKTVDTNTSGLNANTLQGYTKALLLEAVYPIGVIYQSTSGVHPSSVLGFGTWSQIQGRVLIAAGTQDGKTYLVGEHGGDKDAIVVEHTHTITDSGHSHGVNTSANDNTPRTALDQAVSGTVDQTTESATTGITIDNEGISGTDANLPPYEAVYMWKRTA